MSPEPSPNRGSPAAPAGAPPALDDLMSAVGTLAGQGFSAAVGVVRDTHQAIADRVFWALGLAGEPMRLATLPARTLHDAISSLVYELTGSIGEIAGAVGGEIAALVAAGQEAGLRARILVGVLNGMFGDRLALEGNPLATQMFARVDTGAASRSQPAGTAGSAGATVANGTGAAGAESVTPRLVVFVHGLCETEDAWFLWRKRGPGYGERLRVGLGYTPVYLRYNSGRPIAENGKLLAELLEQLVADSPVPVEEIALIGHSMGGLVARQALVNLQGTRTGELVRHIICLGTPHRGAELEAAADAAARVMAWVPETRALAEALGIRAAGIKDLLHGSAERCSLDVEHYFYSVGLGHGLEPLLGDLLVSRRSAWDLGRNESITHPSDHYRHLGDASHFDLLGHPAIGEQLVRWLGGPALLEA
jgi:pimeloyl-ACP methyl ester carboxylesterase